MSFLDSRALRGEANMEDETDLMVALSFVRNGLLGGTAELLPLRDSGVDGGTLLGWGVSARTKPEPPSLLLGFLGRGVENATLDFFWGGIGGDGWSGQRSKQNNKEVEEAKGESGGYPLVCK